MGYKWTFSSNKYMQSRPSPKYNYRNRGFKYITHYRKKIAKSISPQDNSNSKMWCLQSDSSECYLLFPISSRLRTSFLYSFLIIYKDHNTLRFLSNIVTLIFPAGVNILEIRQCLSQRKQYEHHLSMINQI